MKQSDCKLRFFSLLIDGEDVDSGKYEYSPIADALIEKPTAVLEHMRALKLGKEYEVDESLIIAKYCVAEERHIESAISAAYNASKEFRHFSISKRVQIIKEIRRALSERREELLELFVAEAHPRSLAEWELEGMLAGLSDTSLNYFKTKMREEIAVSGNERMYLLRKPDGVVCLIPPRNAPCSNSCTAVLSFLAGNSLIIKPPLKNPASTMFFWRNIVYPVLIKYGAPKGILNIVIGNAKRILDTWLASSKVNDIIFFGDSDKGEKIGQAIFAAGKKPILELSGNDVLVVWRDAFINGAVDSVCDSFLGSSQICMVPKIVLVHPDVYKSFVDRLVLRVKAIKAGLPSDRGASLTPIGRINDFFDFIKDAEQKGAKLMVGGKRINWKNEFDSKGDFVEATVVAIDNCANLLEYDCLKKEAFFPLLPVINMALPGTSKANDDDVAEAMIDLVNNNEYGLRFSIWISSDRYLRRFIKYVDNSGLFRVNSRHVGFSNYLGTHGGPKKSGGPFGEMNYFWQKTSHLQGISRTRLAGR